MLGDVLRARMLSSMANAKLPTLTRNQKRGCSRKRFIQFSIPVKWAMVEGSRRGPLVTFTKVERSLDRNNDRRSAGSRAESGERGRSLELKENTSDMAKELDMILRWITRSVFGEADLLSNIPSVLIATGLCEELIKPKRESQYSTRLVVQYKKCYGHTLRREGSASTLDETGRPHA
ncbi:hypothetical protein J6590_022541 [Homalodisca vitripennis]|nr:hypothetical protein J6590_022541 [Homalodisca vitripennis]